MRTNVDLDENLLKEAFKHSQSKTKKALLHEALTVFIEQRKRRDLRELAGKVQLDDNYDHKALRR